MTWTGRQQRGVSRWILQLCDDLFLFFFSSHVSFFIFFLHTSTQSVCLRAKKIKMDGKTMTKCQKKRCAKEGKEKEEDTALLNRKSSTLFLFASPKDIPGKPVPFF